MYAPNNAVTKLRPTIKTKQLKSLKKLDTFKVYLLFSTLNTHSLEPK